LGKTALGTGLREFQSGGCTNFGHEAVNGLHSIENACTYVGEFFVD
jgi:hypothetical protein